MQYTSETEKFCKLLETMSSKFVLCHSDAQSSAVCYLTCQETTLVIFS